MRPVTGDGFTHHTHAKIEQETAMDQKNQMMKMSWMRFAGMIGISTVLMFFLMYQLI